jgi:peptidoglycan-N-acetylglucosamine deacetylase
MSLLRSLRDVGDRMLYTSGPSGANQKLLVTINFNLRSPQTDEEIRKVQSMIEAGILLAIILGLIAVSLYVWRLTAGRHRRKLYLAGRIAVLSSGVVLLVLFSTYKFMNAREFQILGRIVPRVITSRPVAALTFDDGPMEPYTSELLSVLREKNVKATFFIIGQNLEKFPSLGEDIVRQGHELGNHSYSHERMIFKSYDFIQSEIERTDRLIRRTGYTGEIHFRSPYGKKLFLLPLYLNKVEKKNIFFDVEPDSNATASANRIVEDVLAQTKPGSIILLHAENKNRLESFNAVAEIIDGLKQKGYHFVTVSELLAVEGSLSAYTLR